MVEAFADKGVVRLLTKKMQLCEEQSQRASTRRSGRSRKTARSTSKGAAKAPRAATAGTVLEAPSSVEAKTTSRSSIGKVDSEISHNIVGEEWPRSSSARPLREKNAGAPPFDPDASGNGAQQRSHTRRCDEPRTPTFVVGSNAKSAAPVPPGLGTGKRESNIDARARVAALEDPRGVSLDHQKTPAVIRDKASGGDAKTRHAIPDAAARVTDEAPGETKACSPPLQVVRKDRPSSPCLDIGDGLGTRARSESDEDVLSKQPKNTSDDESATAVLSGSNEDCPHVLSTQSDHRAAGSLSNPPATTAETTGAKTGGRGATEPPSPVGVESVQRLARAEASTAAATPSPTGVLVKTHHATVDEGELGSLLSTFERQVERGAELVRRFEEAAKPRLALDGDDVKAERGDHSKPENENTDLSTMTPSSTSSEEKHFSESYNMATDIAGIAVATEQSVPEPVIGATHSKAEMGSDREPERTEKNSKTEEALLYLGGLPEQPSTGRGAATSRSLSALGEQPPSPATNTTLDEDNEEYEFTFDDEEMIAGGGGGGGQKSVQFTDESRWSTHEVRACFEQHELGELFYTTAELDSMLHEAESEEALERSSALLSQGEELLGDTAVAAGGGSGSLLSGGPKQATTRRASNGAEEVVSIEKVSFDDEDSEYDF